MADLPEFDFDQWLTESRVAQTSVEVLQRPDLLAEVEDWKRRMERAKSLPANPDRSFGEADPVEALKAEGQALIEQIRDSRATFYLAALDAKDERAIEAAHPMPDPPVMFDRPLPELSDRATDAQAQAFLGAWDAWKQAKDEFISAHVDVLAPWQEQTERILELRGAERVARSVVSMKQHGVTTKLHLTAEQVLKMQETFGKPQMSLFIEALDKLKTNPPKEPEVSPAFLSRT